MKAIVWRGDEQQLRGLGREIITLIGRLCEQSKGDDLVDMITLAALIEIRNRVAQRCLLVGQRRYLISFSVQEAIALVVVRHDGLVPVVPGSALLWIADEADRLITGNWPLYLKRML